MNFEEQIRQILFQLGQELKIHKLDNDNFILEIDYEKYVRQISELIKKD